MSLTSITVEQLAEWCAKSEDIADIRAKARADFFGHREPEPANYVADTGSINSRKRRFLGWFVFSLKLSDARHPAELAANALLKEPELGSALRAIRNARYITAVVTGITHGRAFYLKLEDEDFEVNGPALSHILQRGQIVSAHILPARHDQWLLAPGWLTWPILPGPGLRSQLKAFQPDPVEVERFLQGRVKTPEELQKDEQPDDDTLEAAVARMSDTAGKEGKLKLIMPPEEWKGIVLTHMKNNDFSGFVEEIYKRTGRFKSVEEANKWLALATNIWNTTPQPDREGKSANEMARQQRG